MDLLSALDAPTRSIKDVLKALFGLDLYPLSRTALVELGIVSPLFLTGGEEWAKGGGGGCDGGDCLGGKTRREHGGVLEGGRCQCPSGSSGWGEWEGEGKHYGCAAKPG
ncbi:U-box domain-containing protein [Musa troglodytarum]|uniref:U-box domain-containing protein n=1 Tax=Musa troglodytarum TaxID=320322 RepID=A0A9E7GEC1_9LILI|nr:U-box domain-containing protein [Musa troglodytarum]